MGFFFGLRLLSALWLLHPTVSFARTVDQPVDTLPFYTADPVLPSGNEPAGFGCFGACGKSCDCVGAKTGSITTCKQGRMCSWKTLQCKTHSFCQWHDGCYHRCDEQFPGQVDDGSVWRFMCYRSCDLSCVDGRPPEPIGGWTKVKPPGPPPEALGMEMCAKRMAWDESVPYDGTLTYAGNPECVPDIKCEDDL